MEIQEPTLRAMVLHFSWSLAPRFPDSRGAVTDVLRDASGNPDTWLWDSGPMVVVWNEETRLHFLMTGSGLDVVSELPEDPTSLADEVLPACLEILNVKELEDCGAAALWLLAAPDLEAASNGIEQSLLRDDLRQTLEPIGGKPTRVEFLANVDAEHGDARLKVRPATAEELIEDSEYFLSDLESSDLPPAAVVARLQRRRTGEIAVGDAVTIASHILEGVQHAGDKFLARLVSR